MELAYLTDTRQYIAWQSTFHQYGQHRYNLEVVPYSCVIRDEVPPLKFNTLMKELISSLPVMEELIYLLLVDMANAQLRADSYSVYLYLESAIKAGTARPLMQHEPKQSEQNG